MAYYHLDAEYEDMILTAVADSNLEGMFQVETLDTHLKGSEICKVKRMAPEAEFINGGKETAVFIMDAGIMDAVRQPNLENDGKPCLTEDEVKMLIDDTMCKVSFDREKDSLAVNKATTITMTVDAWRKYGAALANAYEKIAVVREAIEQAEKDKKEAEKEAKKAARAQKQSNF